MCKPWYNVGRTNTNYNTHERDTKMVINGKSRNLSDWRKWFEERLVEFEESSMRNGRGLRITRIDDPYGHNPIIEPQLARLSFDETIAGYTKHSTFGTLKLVVLSLEEFCAVTPVLYPTLKPMGMGHVDELTNYQNTFLAMKVMHADLVRALHEAALNP